ncbi:MAG TPA: M17 family peptidase N-terminal domain-containing protein [Myxococcaceae bacterium]|nr:M17 family peptidase N-terminal domain-containing protein [Myxococcaceae bacterium]
MTTVAAHELSLEALDTLTGVDTLCLFVAEDERPLAGAAGLTDWRLCGRLSRLLVEGFFTGAADDSVLLPSAGRIGPGRIVVFGLGRAERLADGPALGARLAAAAAVLNRAGASAVALEVPGGGVLPDAERVRALRAGFLPAFQGRHVAVLGDRALGKLLGS